MTSIDKILLIDSDDFLIETLNEQIKDEFSIVAVKTADEALLKTKNRFFDIIVFNVNNFELNFQKSCQKLCYNNAKSPILVLTDSEFKEDLKNNFRYDVIDYLKKPFRLNVLITRLRLNIFKHERNNNIDYLIGPFSFQPFNKKLINIKSKKIIRLTDKETSILKFLYDSKQCIVSREILLNKVWGYNEGISTHTLETHIYRLRKKIQVEGSKNQILQTKEGGYCLVT